MQLRFPGYDKGVTTSDGNHDGTPPGHYLMVGPNWKGHAPAGINAVVESSTELVFSIPRVFKDDTPADAAAVLPLINQVLFYPLSEYNLAMKR